MRALSETFGASLRPLPREQAQSKEIKPGVGLVVGEVTPGSVADKGGLKSGDVIFQVEDQWVINPAQFATLLTIQEVDDDFEIKVRRGSERVDLDYKLDQAAIDAMNTAVTSGGRGGNRPNSPGDRPAPPPPPPPAGGMND